MTLNRRSIKWLPKIGLRMGLIALAFVVVMQLGNSSAETNMFVGLEHASLVKTYLLSFLP